MTILRFKYGNVNKEYKDSKHQAGERCVETMAESA